MTTDNALMSFWNGLDRSRRSGLIVGAVVCVALALALLSWATRKDYAVLFSQLAEGDAAAIVEQLKQKKVPYRLADAGATIKVPAEQVHETRLGLMAGGVPLSGGVGFELFDRQGLGATEQSQRVTYQRALQGELARSIGALENVKQARVHLVLPESSLFKRERMEPKAAVTLALKQDAVLSREQIIGVQRLVAASVAGLDAGKVVITDQRGVTLSGADALGQGAGMGEARFAMKREIENYVARKVVALLDRTYGPGQAIVSVDVALNFDEIKRTVEDLVPVQGVAGSQESGVRRRRQQTSARAVSGDMTSEHENASPSNSSTEVEYEFGRRIEQVVAAPGGISRMSVGVVVPGSIDAEKQQRIVSLVRVAAGVDEKRGDAIAVQSLGDLGVISATDDTAQAPALAAPKLPQSPQTALEAESATTLPILAVAGVLLFLLLLLVAAHWRRVSKRPDAAAAQLAADERERLLMEIRAALADPTPAAQKVRA